MLKYKLLNEPDEDEPIVVSLRKCEGNIVWGVKRGNDLPWDILMLDADGTIYRCESVPQSFGFQLDGKGRVVIADD